MKNWLARHPHSQTALRWLQRWGGLVLLAVVAVVMTRQARSIDWGGVAAALRATPDMSLVAAAALTVLSYFTYACYDLVGRRQIGHHVLPRHCLRIAAVSYAINLTLGAMLGGAATRLRLYSAAGLKPEQTAGVILSAIYTNWIGLAALAATLFAIYDIRMPADLPGSELAARLIQWVGSIAVLVYLTLCAWKGGQALAADRDSVSASPWQRLPGWRLSLAQVGLGALNWLWVAAVWRVLLGDEVAFGNVVGMVAMASLAGVIIRVPGGLGVMEAVAVGMLSGPQLPPHAVLAGALLFRAIYCILPLLAAAGFLVVTELRQRRTRREGSEERPARKQDDAPILKPDERRYGPAS
ncbi:lysylphosphatidylglycerol synthase domain-containing protein [Uliginosibacterium sp. H1]|uniref:lysylphosphatidylglycerol synthase domain-containing protein n=1 Tax=Uliginosibacterium sp. H1 TaxID=3114757 RepID=UPI002E16E52B|nr:lysylphosphatidylglycerol synthase domain-containing protein [Uliginosibacterium sp. H1]